MPDSIRERHQWVKPGSVVSIKSAQNQIVLEPYSPEKKEVDWDKIWEGIKRARAIKGKNKGSLSGFIVKDRETHF